MNIIRYSHIEGFSDKVTESCKELVIAIDSRLISTHQITLPKMSNAKAKKAIPFALESRLLDDINTLEFFSFKHSDANTWDVFVIAQQVLIDLKQKLQHIKCEPVAVVPDFMLLNFQQKKITYLENDGKVTYRSGKLQGGTLSTELFHQMFGNNDQVTQSQFTFKLPARVNLITTDIQADWQKHIQPWKMPTIAALLILTISSAQTLINNSQLDEQLSQQTIKNEQQFRQLFPDIKRIVDMRVQAGQRLDAAKRQKSKYNNDLLTQLSASSKSNMQAVRLVFKNQTLVVEDEK